MFRILQNLQSPKWDTGNNFINLNLKDATRFYLVTLAASGTEYETVSGILDTWNMTALASTEQETSHILSLQSLLLSSR